MRRKYGWLLSMFILAACSQTPETADLTTQAGSSYYLDCSVAGSGNGSQASPWNSFATVNSRTFAAGDKILLKRGTTCQDKGTLHPKGSGSAANPITLGAYGSGSRPWIKAGSNHAVKLLNQSGWVIRDLRVSSSVSGTHDDTTPCNACYSGVTINATDGRYSHFRVVNVEADGNWTGISLGEYKSSGDSRAFVPDNNQGALEDIILDGVFVHNNEGKGVLLAGNYESIPTRSTPSYPRNRWVTVRNSEVYNNGEDGVLFSSVDDAWIHDNVSYNNGAKKDARYALWFWNAKNVHIQNNEAYGNKTPGSKDGGAYDCDWHVQNCTVEYNYSHDNQGPMVLLIGYQNGGSPDEALDGCTVRYNVSHNDVTHPSNSYGPITFFGAVKNCQVYNNSVYFANASNPNAAGLKAYTYNAGGEVFGNGVNNTVRNNLFYLANGAKGMSFAASHIGGGNSYDFDLFYAPGGNVKLTYGSATHSTVAALCGGTGQECDGVQGNPLLVPASGADGFALTPGSAAINAGTPVGSVSWDYGGNSAFQGPARDIGAFESSNWLKNPGGEVGSAINWLAWGKNEGGATNQSQNVKSGAYALWAGPESGRGQTVGDVSAGSTYTLEGWGKVYTSAGNAKGWLGLKSTSGTAWDCNLAFTETSYTFKRKDCTVPSGVAVVAVYLWAGSGSYMWGDDLALEPK